MLRLSGPAGLAGAFKGTDEAGAAGCIQINENATKAKGKEHADPDRVLPSALGLRISAPPASDDAPGGTLQYPHRRGTGVHRRAGTPEENGRRAEHHCVPAAYRDPCTWLPRRPAPDPASAAGRPGAGRRKAGGMVLHPDGPAAAEGLRALAGGLRLHGRAGRIQEPAETTG